MLFQSVYDDGKFEHDVIVIDERNVQICKINKTNRISDITSYVWDDGVWLVSSDTTASPVYYLLIEHAVSRFLTEESMAKVACLDSIEFMLGQEFELNSGF